MTAALISQSPTYWMKNLLDELMMFIFSSLPSSRAARRSEANRWLKKEGVMSTSGASCSDDSSGWETIGFS